VAASHPEQFAAIAPISGGMLPPGDALNALLSKLKGMPVLAAHGTTDTIIPAQMTKTMVAAAEKAGVKATVLEVPNGDHLSVVAATFPAVMDFFEKNPKAPR